MNCTVHIDSPLTDEERRARLYAGDIFIFSPNPHSRRLIELGSEMIEEAFKGLDPRKLHETMAVEAVVEVLTDLKPRFIHHPMCKELIPAMLDHWGIDLEKIYFDVPRMRTAYPSDFLSSGIAYAFHPHRDTWYSAPAMQLNWWLPIYQLDRENCMGFYPNSFRLAGQEQQRNLQLLSMERAKPRDRGAACQDRHAGAAKATGRSQGAEHPLFAAAGWLHPVLRCAAPRNDCEHERCRALQHRFSHRASR